MSNTPPTDTHGSGEPLEVRATSAVLTAAAFWIDSECAQVNDMFMACRRQHTDPANCAEAGLAVSSCVNTLFSKLGRACRMEFERYWKCLDVNNQSFMYCRAEEEPLTQCALQKLGLTKRLWRGQGPQDGFKDDGALPAKDSWPYQWHVYQHKRKP